MFLMYRTLIHGVSAPCYWDTSESVNYMSRYYFRHVNLREVLSKYHPRTAAPLDELSKLCRFPGKLGMDGSQVERAWELGRANAVRAYCETDVTNTWLLRQSSLRSLCRVRPKKKLCIVRLMPLRVRLMRRHQEINTYEHRCPLGTVLSEILDKVVFDVREPNFGKRVQLKLPKCPVLCIATA